jgi:hypothetical protein
MNNQQKREARARVLAWLAALGYLALIVVMALYMTGCGGTAGDSSDAGEPAAEGGWCCDGVCGMDEEDHTLALSFGYTCTCDGVVRGADRECVEAQQ